MNSENACEYLEWDSNFFGKRIARSQTSQLTIENVGDILLWCERHRIDCLYFLADSTDPETPTVAECNNFHLVDIRLTLECLLETTPAFNSGRLEIRPAQTTDIPTLRTIARTSHKHSRFYYDGNFSATSCDALYETWIEKSCLGWARRVFVGVDSGLPIAYITCDGGTSRAVAGSIGLVGVAKEAQRTGVGTILVNRALHWFGEQGLKKVSVVTQGRNVRAQRLYQRNGFLSRSTQLWYHKWFNRR